MYRSYVTGTKKSGSWIRARPTPQVTVAGINEKVAKRFKYLIYSTTDGPIKACAIEAARVTLKRNSKTPEMWKIEADTPVTRKSIGSRMGKGKGKIDHYIAKVSAGSHLYFFNCSDEFVARYTCRQVDYRLPVKAKLIETQTLLDGQTAKSAKSSKRTIK